MRIIGFSFNVYLSKKVGAESLGIFGLITSVYMFFITIATSGIQFATTKIIVAETAFINDSYTRKSYEKVHFI